MIVATDDRGIIYLSDGTCWFPSQIPGFEIDFPTRSLTGFSPEEVPFYCTGTCKVHPGIPWKVICCPSTLWSMLEEQDGLGSGKSP